MKEILCSPYKGTVLLAPKFQTQNIVYGQYSTDRFSYTHCLDIHSECSKASCEGPCSRENRSMCFLNWEMADKGSSESKYSRQIL